jgi:lysophospholipase L1-like esterase
MERTDQSRAVSNQEMTAAWRNERWMLNTTMFSLALSLTGLFFCSHVLADTKPSDSFQKPAWWNTQVEPSLKKAETWDKTIRLSFPRDYYEVDKFYYVGPFDNEDGKGFARAYPPEQGVDLVASYKGSAGEILKWQEAPPTWNDAASYHDLSVIKKKDWAVVYVAGYFNSDHAQTLQALAGSDDTLSIWLNGEKVLAHEIYRAAGAEQERVSLNVKPGRNEILLKICQGTGGWGFYFDLHSATQRLSKGRSRAKLLAALMDLCPQDHSQAYEARLEIADIFRAEGSPKLAKDMIQSLARAYPCAETQTASASFLTPGDHLALLGDSITEQRRYTRVIETYLTTAYPQLRLDIRQFGWGGETLSGILKRLDSDVLRFKPDAVTFCYGMNDFSYRAFDKTIAGEFEGNLRTLIRRLKKAGAKVLAASPGAISRQPSWSKEINAGPEIMNDSLYRFGKIEETVAQELGAGFFSNLLPMVCSENQAQQLYGRKFRWSEDGVHPGWGGHLIMASNFLGAFGLDGEIGHLEIDLKKGSASASEGHKVLSFEKGALTLQSSRFPFSLGAGELSTPDSLASAEVWSDFQNRFNRFILAVHNAPSGRYRVTWGPASRIYSSAQLARGVNLARDFSMNPLSSAFQKVDQLVALKQELETYEIKQVAHGPTGARNLDNALSVCEGYRDQLISDIHSEMQPVIHRLEIQSLAAIQKK